MCKRHIQQVNNYNIKNFYISRVKDQTIQLENGQKTRPDISLDEEVEMAK